MFNAPMYLTDEHHSGTNVTFVHFASAEMAAHNVAGLPAAARAVREVALSGAQECWLVLGDDQVPGPLVDAEIRRLSGPMRVVYLVTGQWLTELELTDNQWISGEALVASLPSCALDCLNPASDDGLQFDHAARRIVTATSKPGDGIVSRHLNRPISQAISRVLLRWPAVRPVHATLLNAALAVAMLACLLAGGATGLIAGALLFQAASIADGIDGEIARATYRTSASGARLDSLIDAATNLGFVGGVIVNLWLDGKETPALAGAAGLAAMLAGLSLIGIQSSRSGGPFTFNAVKEHFSSGGSAVMQWLTWLTMRDFIAFAAVLFVVTGFAATGLVILTVVALVWLAVVVTVLGISRRALLCSCAKLLLLVRVFTMRADPPDEKRLSERI